MSEQMTIFDVIADEVEEIQYRTEELFEPNGRQRCEHCRKRLHPIGTTGRLVCVNPYCAGGE
jgi:hypothetical protein